MYPVLLDTSVYVNALRGGDQGIPQYRRVTSGTVVWLSAVVLEELYAGTEGERARSVEGLEHDFERAKRILVPNLKDWAHTGKILARLRREDDYEEKGQARLTNDALIAMSAARNGITVITANERDFGRLAKLRPFQWRMAV